MNKEKLNKSLIAIGETPAKKRKLEQKRYPHEKFQKVRSANTDNFFQIEDPSTSIEKSDNKGRIHSRCLRNKEMLKQ